MDGIKEFRKFQLGREVKNGGSPGAAVAATAIMRGVWIGSDDTPRNYPAENIGMMIDTTRSYVPYVLGSIQQGPDPLTFEQFPYILAAAIRAVEVGKDDGAGSGQIYHYPWPKTAADVEKTATTISFVAATKTIADSGNGLGFIQDGDLIRVSGSTSNDGIYRVVTAAAGSITVAETLSDESAGDSVTIEVLTQTYTAEGGNNARVERSTYGFPTSFELSGRGGSDMDAIMLTSAWITRQWQPLAAGFSSGISLPAVSEALFGHCKLYIDDIGGTLGATEKTNTLASFSYKANTGLRHQFAGTGNLYFAEVKRKQRIQIACAISLYQNAAGLAEYDAWRSGTPRLIRIKIEGPALATAGATYSKKTILLDMPGSWVSFPKLEDIEGAEILPGQFRPAYDPTAGIGPSITVVNELAQLP